MTPSQGQHTYPAHTPERTMVSFFKDAGTIPRNTFPRKHPVPYNSFVREDATT